MSSATPTNRPNREPDFFVEGYGDKYGFEYWEEEQVIGFHASVGVKHYTSFRVYDNKLDKMTLCTPKQFINYILEQNSVYNDNHLHYRAVYDYVVESILLS